MNHRILMVCLACLVSGHAVAQNPKRPAHPNRPGNISAWDANKNGKIERWEFRGHAPAFDRLDRNKDGALTMGEIRNPDREPQNQFVRGDVNLQANICYGKGGRRNLTFDMVRPLSSPSTSMPVLVYIHGGGWRSGNSQQGLAALTPFVKQGYCGVSLNYRHAPEAIFPAQIEDCKAAIRFLRSHASEYGIDPNRIGVWGASAGGHLAALLGTSGGIAALEGNSGAANVSSRVQAICDWYGPSDFLADSPFNRSTRGYETMPVNDLLGGEPRRLRDKAKLASPVTHVSADDPPFLILHGTSDPVVPFSQSESLASALRKAGVQVQLYPIPGGGHGGAAFDTADVQALMSRFFNTVLRHKPVGSIN